ncbi:hypothetical protein [Desulfopila sp. IMCC35008]|uniref:hypothetical protein n=1 Tax=Desulfopila sp. IMCC35008 TaxID=2653858 RepID=UPI0013CFCBA9|nr:hypothetical protein [Desulfopila sp. IMCC35008]
MKIKDCLIIVAAALLFSLAGGCSVHQEKTEKYPRKPADDPERKSGPAMFFYEAAEKDADLNNIIVTPPPSSKEVKTTP